MSGAHRRLTATFLVLLVSVSGLGIFAHGGLLSASESGRIAPQAVRHLSPLSPMIGRDSPTILTSGAHSTSHFRAVHSSQIPQPLPSPVNWTDLTTSEHGRPSARGTPGLVYDSHDDVAVLFGGFGPINSTYGVSSETWTYSNGSWAEVQPIVHPSARNAPLMADSPPDKGILLWGGQPRAGSGLNDTWLYSGGAWSNLSRAGSASPPAQPPWTGAMSYDSTDGVVVLVDPVGTATETWEFVGGVWSNVTPTTRPAASPYPMILADDPAGHGVLLVGGTSGNETWRFASDNWSRLAPVNPLPASANFAGAYDPTLGALVLAGGFVARSGGGLAPSNGTWWFDNDTWSLLSAAPMPAEAVDSGATYDRVDGYMVFFGGLVNRSTSFTYENETWALGDPVLARPVASPNPTDVGVNVSFVNPYQNTTLGYSQSWTLGDGNATPLGRFSHAYASTGTYVVSLVATDGAGHFNNTTVRLAAFSRPVVTVSTGSLPADVGVPVNFTSVVVAGAPPLSYDWAFGDLNRSTSHYPTHTFGRPGTYTVVLSITDNAGVVVRANVSLRVNPPPTISLRLNWPVLDLGQPLALTASLANGTGPFQLSYQGLPAGCTPGNVSFYSCVPTSDGVYSLSVSLVDARGSRATSLPMGLSIYLPLSIFVSASVAVSDLGQWVNFTVATGDGAPGPVSLTYSGLPSGCLPDPGVRAWQCQPGPVGSYNITVTARDSSAEASSSLPLRLTVNPAPVLNFTSAPGSSLRAGESVSFFANVTGGTPPYRYAFQGLPPGCTSGNQSEVQCVASAAGTYNVLVSVVDAVGVERNRNLSVTVALPGPEPGTGPVPWATLTTAGAVAAVATALLVLALKRRRAPPTQTLAGEVAADSGSRRARGGESG